MRAHGNGAPQVCVNNLLQLFRGEVPYERVKGLDPRLYDKPFSTADAQLRQDADWLIDTYEPRAEIRSITVEQSDAVGGGFTVTAEIQEKEG
jgi:phage baseplate assembly protein W